MYKPHDHNASWNRFLKQNCADCVVFQLYCRDSLASNAGNGTTAIETVHLNGLICTTIQRWTVTSYIYCVTFTWVAFWINCTSKSHFCTSTFTWADIEMELLLCCIGPHWLYFSFYSFVILLIFFTLCNCLIWSEREFCASPIKWSCRYTVASHGQSQSPLQAVDTAVKIIAGGLAAMKMAESLIGENDTKEEELSSPHLHCMLGEQTIF